MNIPDLLATSLLAVALSAACSSEPTKRSSPSATAVPADPATLGMVTGQIASPQPGAIVTLTARTSPSASQPASPVLDQVQMTFVPDMVLTQSGVPVVFRSSDTELHNINVRNADTRESAFNRSIIPEVPAGIAG